MQQASEEDFFKKLDDQGNSIAVILKHISGNLLSSFTDFLMTDGEKEWRDRESEFQVGKTTKAELMKIWSNS